IRLRAGYGTDLRGPLLNVRVPLRPDIRLKHQVFYYLAITEFLETYFLGRTTTVAVEPDCSVPLDGDSMDRAVALLRSLDLDPDQPFFCLCPGSVNSEAKRWPDDCFRRLADLLAHGLDARVVFLGAPQERSLVDMIISGMQHPAALNLAGQADILTSMAIMNRSQLVISNDAGSAHLAVAASARVLTIFGPTIVGATAPYGPNAHVIQGEAPCAPCRHFLCPLPGHPCMRSVDPEAVFEKAEMILAEARGL
ncbi:MAG: glycosyltransferase family 9 protein, partial [Deltaproteobacteria bacterium]|nr:glycosyltransferase family 9 protein [Deltaproteobacteria bacterium]